MTKIIYKTEQDWTDVVTQRFWDYKVTENHPYFTEEVGLGILKMLKQKIDIKGDILDYGCGNGAFIGYLAKEFPNNVIFGLDFSRDSVNESIRKNANLTNVKSIIHFEDLEKNHQANSFDIIFLIETIEHLRSDLLTKTLGIIHNLLKPNGYLIVTTPFDENLQANSVYCPFCDAAHHHMQHVQSFTIERLSAVLSENKLTPVEVNNTDFNYFQNRIAFYKLNLKWWLKLKLGLSKRLPFQKKHLFGIAQKQG